MNKTTDNPNTELDPQDETYALAHMTHEESEGYENSRECNEDYHLDSCYESTCDMGE